MIGSKPMIESGNQKMSVFNEVATSLYLYVVILLTEFMGDTGLRDEIGWALLVLVIGVVVINFLRILLNLPGFIKLTFQKIKRCSNKNPTVSINPSLAHKKDSVNDMATVSHTADLFSRNPMERELELIRKRGGEIRATQCPPIDFA